VIAGVLTGDHQKIHPTVLRRGQSKGKRSGHGVYVPESR
jgi:hypothetical protein